MKHGKVDAGTVVCASACGKVEATARKGKTVLARAKLALRTSKGRLNLKLTAAGKRPLSGKKPVRATLAVKVTPPGGTATTVTAPLRLLP